jgi:hypothetical protein
MELALPDKIPHYLLRRFLCRQCAPLSGIMLQIRCAKLRAAPIFV